MCNIYHHAADVKQVSKEVSKEVVKEGKKVGKLARNSANARFLDMRSNKRSSCGRQTSWELCLSMKKHVEPPYRAS